MWHSINKSINSRPAWRSVKRRLLDPLYRQWFYWHKGQSHKWVYQVSGMRRSGNHAFLNWLIGQMPGSVAFLNNLGPFQPPEHNEINKLYWQGWQRSFLVVSYEDQPTFKTIKPYTAERFGPAQKEFQILILRDPYNFLASRIAWPDAQGASFREKADYRNQIIEMWKEQARRFLEMQHSENPHRIAVSFNHWFADVQYRRQLSEQLQLPFSDRGFHKVTAFGHGSSFDGTRYHGRAQEAPVLERYRQMPEHSHYALYRKLCRDAELEELGRKIFGDRLPKF